MVPAAIGSSRPRRTAPVVTSRHPVLSFLSGLLVALVVTGAFVHAPPAVACSCSGPATGPSPAVLVEGRVGDAVGDPRPDQDGTGPRPSSWMVAWRLTVERVERGPLEAGDGIEMHLTEGSGAGCGVSVGPVDPGRAYRVGGSYDETTRRLHLNLCSNPILEPLGPAPVEDRTSRSDEASPSEGESATPTTFVAEAPVGSAGLDRPLGALGLGAVMAAVVGLFLVRRRIRAGADIFPTNGSA